jgi:predicted nuclease of restriction endonuclease-like RecB superfamily
MDCKIAEKHIKQLRDELALFHAARPAKPLSDEQRAEVLDRAAERWNSSPINWREAIITETEAAHGIKETK